MDTNDTIVIHGTQTIDQVIHRRTTQQFLKRADLEEAAKKKKRGMG